MSRGVGIVVGVGISSFFPLPSSLISFNNLTSSAANGKELMGKIILHSSLLTKVLLLTANQVTWPVVRHYIENRYVGGRLLSGSLIKEKVQ